MCSPPWPSSTWVLRQRQVVGHYYWWHHMASCDKGENGRHYHSPAVTNSSSQSQCKTMMDKPTPPSWIVHITPLHHSSLWHLWCTHTAGFSIIWLDWAGLSSAPFCSAVFITRTCILPWERGTKWHCFCCVVAVGYLCSHVPSNDVCGIEQRAGRARTALGSTPAQNCEKTGAVYQQETQHREDGK